MYTTQIISDADLKVGMVIRQNFTDSEEQPPFSDGVVISVDGRVYIVDFAKPMGRIRQVYNLCGGKWRVVCFDGEPELCEEF